MMKRNQYLIILLFVFIINAFDEVNAQNATFDSLYLQVILMKDDTLKVLELNELSDKYMGFQLDTAFDLGQRAYDLSKKLDYQYGIAKSLFQLGLVSRYQGKYEKAIEYSNLSYSLFNNLNKSSEKARVLNSLGNVYKRNGNYEKSLENFLGCIRIYEKLQDSLNLHNAFNNLGLLYGKLLDYDKSLEYLNKSLDLRRMLGLNNQIVSSLNNIGMVYSGMKEYNSALNYYKEALDLADNNTSKYTRVLLIYNIGIAYELTGRYNSAKQYYSKAIGIAEEIGDKDQLIASLQGMGNILIITGDNTQALEYYHRSNNLAIKLGNLPFRKGLSKNLSSAYEKIGNYEKSLEYYKIYQSINDSLLGIEKVKQIAELEQKYDAEKRDQQIAFLEKEKEIQDLELSNKVIESKQKSFQRNVLIFISFVAIALLIYYFRDNKKRIRLNNLLRKQNKKIIDQRTEIAKQNDKLVESNNTKDRLFQIIAHDLRSPLVSIDSITQLIPFWLEEKDYESLKKLSSSLEVAINNVLSLIDNLLNWALSQQGEFPFKPEQLKLKDTIQEIIRVYEPIAQIKNIDLLFKMSGDITVFADKNMLLTVLRNLLNNAIKFTGEKGVIMVGMESNQEFARVWIKDSGVGIPDDKKDGLFDIAKGNSKGTRGETGKGLGLFFCKEFVSMNNGNIFIDSKVGEGTTITFTVPLYDINEV